jgi:uncharacterized membrane-anchored protein YhcB (DUF1043 family)
LPSPFDAIAEAIYKGSEGSPEQKIDKVKEYFEDIQKQGKDHYKEIASQLDNITQDILNVKIETAKESTLLIVKDILISSKKRQDVTLERIDEIKRILSEDRSSKYVETKEVLEKHSKELERHLNYSKCLFDKVNPINENL